MSQSVEAMVILALVDELEDPVDPLVPWLGPETVPLNPKAVAEVKVKVQVSDTAVEAAVAEYNTPPPAPKESGTQYGIPTYGVTVRSDP